MLTSAEVDDEGDMNTEATVGEQQDITEDNVEGDSGGGDKEEKGTSKADLKLAVETMELRQVIPALIKNGVVFFLGTWVAGKLSPGVEQQVRVARILYTGYLIFSHALFMYLRCVNPVIFVTMVNLVRLGCCIGESLPRVS